MNARATTLWISCATLISFTTVIWAADASALWQSVPLLTKRQAQQGLAGGEGFQKIIAIEYAFSNPKIVYFGTDTSQVWKSTDGGKRWAAASDDFIAKGARSLYVDPEDPEIVLAAGFLGPEKHRVSDKLSPTHGIFRTINGGASWTFVKPMAFYKQESTGRLFASLVKPGSTNSRVIYVGGYMDGLHKSYDGGASWEYTHINKGPVRALAAIAGNKPALLMLTDKGLFKIENDKATKVGSGLPGVPLSISASRSAPGFVFAVLGRQGVYVSQDGGISFKRRSDGLPLGGVYSDVEVSPVAPNIIYVGTNLGRPKGPFRSNDGGTTWYSPASRNSKKLVPDRGFHFSSPLTAHPQEPNVALTASNGKASIRMTEDAGHHWFYSNTGYTAGRVQDIAFDGDGSLIMSLTDHGLWQSDRARRIFNPIKLPDMHPNSSRSVAIVDSTILASVGGWKNKRLLVSYDSGSSWKIFDALKGAFHLIAIHPQRKQVIYADKYKSTDGGKSWEKLGYPIRSVLEKDGDFVLGYDKAAGKIHLSRDGGETWFEAFSTPSRVRIYQFDIAPQNHELITLATSEGLFRRNDNAWVEIGDSTGLVKDQHGGLQTLTLARNPVQQNQLFVGRWAPGKGTANGIFKSEDGGVTWTSYNLNLGNSFNVWSINYDPSGNSVYIGTSQGLKVLSLREGK